MEDQGVQSLKIFLVKDFSDLQLPKNLTIGRLLSKF